MNRNHDDERLGMFRNITRRDFLKGTALAIAAQGRKVSSRAATQGTLLPQYRKTQR